MSYAGPPSNFSMPPQSTGYSGPGQTATASTGVAGVGDSEFEIFEWHPAYQSCQRYFLDHAQHDASVQAAAALLNISLPFQWTASPVTSSSSPSPHSSGPSSYSLPWPRQGPVASSQQRGALAWVSLVPFIRRLVVTGFDTDGVLHGFFGDEWKKGAGPIQECERRNYLFAAKSGGWARVKSQYDISPHETVPFLKPLQNVQLAEIEAAEKSWSQWLAMEDWMVGPRAPETMGDAAPGGHGRNER